MLDRHVPHGGPPATLRFRAYSLSVLSDASSDLLAQWLADFHGMEVRWDQEVVAAEERKMARWLNDIGAISQEYVALRGHGQWLVGPTDWLGVLLRERHEMTHSRLLGWLCDPSGQHGLGTDFLGRFLALVKSPHGADPSATVALEVTGPSALSRADIVITLPEHSVVVENKIGAQESTDQCLLLADDHPEPAHLVLLTPGQQRPTTAGASEHRWIAVRWADVALLVETVVASASGPSSYIVQEYATTLRRLFR